MVLRKSLASQHPHVFSSHPLGMRYAVVVPLVLLISLGCCSSTPAVTVMNAGIQHMLS